MEKSFLFPPYSNLLSNRVVGQRVEPLHSRFDGDISNIAHQYLPPLRSHADEIKLIPERAQGQKPAKKYKMKMSPVRREQCRVNQARYRNKQRQYAQDLDHEVHQLQDAIQYLETKRQNILRNSLTEQTVWIVATEYFRHFRQGYMAPSTTTGGTTQHIQLDFLKETMASDVTDGAVCGVKELLENWTLFLLFHGDVNVQLKNLEKHTGGSLLATTTTSITITENTLHHLYPHLVNGIQKGSDEGKLLPLALKLLNQRLLARGSVWFGWDETTARVARLETKIDMLTAILKLVDNAEDVARVFDGALITPEGNIR